MAKATIKSSTGATITIEGSPDEVARVVASVETMSGKGSSEKEAEKKKTAKRAEKKRDSASDLIISMKEEGFFEKPKSLGEIGAALEERGYLYPLTTLSGVVLALLKRKELRRKKVDGKWVYGK